MLNLEGLYAYLFYMNLGVGKLNPYLVKIYSCFIFNKKQRQLFRKNKLEKHNEDLLKKTRFGVSYSVFDGIELLEPSILSIRSQVDYINVVYQTHSWYGEKSEENILEILNTLKNKKLIDEIIEYKAKPSKPAGYQELEKRNLGLKMAKRAKVNYFMTMDVDEFYLAHEIKKAKATIINKNITRSFVPQIMYGFKPTEQKLSFNKNCYVSFFSKINMFSKLGKNSKTPCLVDKTRKFAYSIFEKNYVLDGVEMHHMSRVRKDYAKKMRNSSTLDPNLHYPNDDVCDKIVEVEDVFDIERFLK